MYLVRYCNIYLLVCAIMFGLYVDYGRLGVGYICAKWQTYCLGTYANSVKFMFSSAPCQTVDCSNFMWGKYTGTLPCIDIWNNYHVWLICGIWGTDMVSPWKLKLQFGFFFWTGMCSNMESMCRLWYQCSGIYMCNVTGIFVQGICQ